MKRALTILLKFQKDGFLFHGSSEKLTFLEPRKASDTDKNRSFNSDTAVFATPNFLFAIPFGCISNIIKKLEVPEPITWSIGFKDDRPFVQADFKFTPEMLSVFGFVHVLHTDPFVVSDLKGMQYKAFKSVKPVAVISASLQDFIAGGGILE